MVVQKGDGKMVAIMCVAGFFGLGSAIYWASKKIPAVDDLLDRLTYVVLLRGRY